MKRKLTAAGTLSCSGFERQAYHKANLLFVTAMLLVFSAARAQDANTAKAGPELDSVIEISRTPAATILYGEQSKTRLLQSVATVYTNQLTSTPSPQFLQALPGRIPGLNITFNSGGPGLDGNGMSYNIRGARAQIILIDGVERGYLSIDPEQIESISVLKDALSTVLFGHRSSYGIISIRTKKGDGGKPRISFTAQSGFETPTALPKPLPAWQYATLYNEAKQNDAGTTPVIPQYTQDQIDAYQNQTDPYTYPDVDWYNTVLKNRAGVRRYNLNIQGSGKGFRYFVDLDNMKEKGIINTSDENKYNTNTQLDRYALRSNVGVDVTPITFAQLNIFGRFQRYNQPGGGVGGIFSSLLNTPQLAYPVFNPDGTFGGTDKYQGNANIWGQAVARGYQFQDVRDIAVDLEVTQKLDVLTRGLSLKAKASNNNTAYYTTRRIKDFEVYQYLNNGYTKYGSTTEQKIDGGANERYRIVYLEGSLGYDRIFKKHAISVLTVANQQNRLAFNLANLPEKYTALSGKLNYCFNEKYVAEGAVSYGGYNWLAPSKRWATYWAAGLGWNLHREAFISRNLPFISNLKLRANYGLTGQANAGYFSYIQSYFSGNGYWFGSGSSLDRASGENAIANAGLDPEKAKKLDAGIDLGLWHNKLTITADYFFNKFYDLVAAPAVTTTIFGTGYPLQNYQRLNYSGTDISVTWQQSIKKFTWFVSGNFSLVRTEIMDNAELASIYDFQTITAKLAGQQYGYTAIGLFKSYDEINDASAAVLPSSPRSSLRPGDIRYLDRDGDGQITVDDQDFLGNKNDIYYGFHTGFSFKGVDLSVLVQGTLHRQSYFSGDFMNGFGNSGQNNAYEYNLGRFTAETAETAQQPRLWLGNNTNNTQTSSFWLKDNDFVRLRNVELGYTFPEKLSRKIGLPSVRFFANGLNLLTWAEIHDMRKDLDPEAWGAAYPIMKIVNFGINIKF
jgi:TonB-linked SusC/RagA family outer membrane protein